jgi:hypothetical protein
MNTTSHISTCLHVLTSEHVHKNILEEDERPAMKVYDVLTMLRRFHAMNNVKAHPTLPQSDSDSVAGDEFVQRGYTIALQTTLIINSRKWKDPY